RASSDRRNLDGLDAEIRIGDLRDAVAVSRAVAGCDEVYHVAADYRLWSERPSAVYESNVQGTANVMDACLQQGVERVVYTSTVGTIGLGGRVGPFALCDEQSPIAEGQFCGHYK